MNDNKNKNNKGTTGRRLVPETYYLKNNRLVSEAEAVIFLHLNLIDNQDQMQLARG